MNKTKLKIAIIGTGNVAFHLHHAINKASQLDLVQVCGRTKDALTEFDCETKVTSLDELTPSDIYIIAISDDAIENVAKHLGHLDGLIVHTSGAKPMSALASVHNYGVFYPLQSFTKHVPVAMSEVPMCIEANSADNLITLQHLAEALSNKVFLIDSKQRETLHLSAVFVNNFTNYMFTTAEDLCETNGIPFEVLFPLIQETAQKALNNSPYNNQTGPAKRGDQKTIEQHLELLKDSNYRSMYEELTNQIKRKYKP